MNFKFTRITAIVNELGRPALGRIFKRPGKDRSAVSAGRKIQAGLGGGLYGMLISNESMHRH